MTSFRVLCIGLSLVFGCLLLAFVAELYYLLWWKKRFANTEIEHKYNNYAKELIQLFCWKKPASLHSSSNNINQDIVRDTDSNGHEQDLELGSRKELLLKDFGEESVEAELMRLHNLSGPPRFLFTINEETKEDLESDDGKSRGDRSRKGSRTRSLSDILVTVDTPFLTPMASPRIKSPTLNPLDSYHRNGFNPLFESSAEYELNRFRSSPPPKFKFLRDAEEKLLRRLKEEAEKRARKNSGLLEDSDVKALNDSTTVVLDDREGSFLKFIVGKNREREHLQHLRLVPSSSSQVLPLASSPTTFRPLDQKPIVH